MCSLRQEAKERDKGFVEASGMLRNNRVLEVETIHPPLGPSDIEQRVNHSHVGPLVYSGVSG